MVGQGSVAIEARTDDTETRAILALIDHAKSRRAVETERAFLAELGAGCSLPVGAHLSNDGVFRAFMANDDFSDSVQIVGSIGDSDDNRVVGITAAIECRTRLAKPIN
jgi:hydroxymethylbilane synthase